MIETVNQNVTVHILCPHCVAVVDTLDTSREHRPEVTLQMTCNSCYEDFEVTVDTRSGGTTAEIPYRKSSDRKMAEMVKARQREYQSHGFSVQYLGDWGK